MNTAVANATEDLEDRLARSDNLAPAERRVAERLLEFGPEEALLSAAALAERLGTSDATVVRTAKALGYSGLADLRRAIATQTVETPLRERLRRTLEQAEPKQFLAAAIDRQADALDALTRDVSSQQFQTAVGVLAKSKRVVWRGVGPSAHLASYGELLSRRIGKPSIALVQMGTSFADEMLAIARGDAIVVFAYGRLQSHVRVLVERAAELDVPVILITDTLGRKFEQGIHTTLRCGRGAPGLFASHGVTLVVIEALTLAIAATDRARSDATLDTLNEFRAALNGRRIDVDTP
jgi:DNA-binding MurR/RpiR family transcriptional regulator